MQVNAGVRRGVKLISDRRRRVRSCGASQPSHELRPSNGLQSACLTGINTIVPLDNQNEGRICDVDVNTSAQSTKFTVRIVIISIIIVKHCIVIIKAMVTTIGLDIDSTALRPFGDPCYDCRSTCVWASVLRPKQINKQTNK